VSVIDTRSRKELMQIPVGRIPKRIISVELP
jgi:YVTN family beta-propeller protein